MKKEYNAPVLEFVEFDSTLATDGSSVHDGSETSCSCTAYLNRDWTKI